MEHSVDEVDHLRAAYVATRKILRARDVQTAQDAVLTLCRALGADVAAADADDPNSVPIDMSVGQQPPLLPVAADPQVRNLLARYLAPAVLDARTVEAKDLSSNRLIEDALLDPLTGIWNRRALMLAVNRTGFGDCIAMLDLDHFKNVNDTFGHEAGDQVLVAFATHVHTVIREHDIVGRLGGEEFVVLLPRTHLPAACAAIERLRLSWASSGPRSVATPVTFSVGVTNVPAAHLGQQSAGQMALSKADSLLYEAKASGRDQVKCAST